MASSLSVISTCPTLAAPILTNYPEDANFNFKFKNNVTRRLCCDFQKRTPSYVSSTNAWPRLNGKKYNFTPLTVTRAPLRFKTSASVPVLVADKLERLVSEFRSLPEPIDRVKRLLHYAALLPSMDESGRVPENRVMGCTTQVWLEARMDEFGRMRFRVDSDSEITKGFCSCLIGILDDAEPEEVLMVRTEDLMDVNVGFHRKAQSRVNTWHNVLISMQKATEALVVERGRKPVVSLLSDCQR